MGFFGDEIIPVDTEFSEVVGILWVFQVLSEAFWLDSFQIEEAFWVLDEGEIFLGVEVLELFNVLLEALVVEIAAHV